MPPWVPAAQSRGRSLVLQEYSLWGGRQMTKQKTMYIDKGKLTGALLAQHVLWAAQVSFLSLLTASHPPQQVGVLNLCLRLW